MHKYLLSMKTKFVLLIFCSMIVISCGKKETKTMEEYFQIPRSSFAIVSPENKEICINLYVRYGNELEIWIKGDSTKTPMDYETYSVNDHGSAIKVAVPTNPLDLTIDHIGQEEMLVINQSNQSIFQLQVRDHFVSVWAFPPYRIKW